MSTQTKESIIVVVGATGNQGSAVARTFLGLPNWHVRCMTRSTASKKAMERVDLGSELVEADLSSEPSLVQAFQGADAIFLNTDFWGPYGKAITVGKSSPEASKAAYDQELQWGKNAALTASKILTLYRFIYSALPSTQSVSGNKYPNALHWESKAAVVDLIRSNIPGLASKMSLIYVGAYASNAFFRPWPDPDTGGYVSRLPVPRTTVCPIINPSGPAMGSFVRALIEDEEVRTNLLAVEETLSFGEAIATWGRVPLEVLEVPAYLAEHHFMAGIDDFIDPSHLERHVATQTYEQYLRSLDEAELLGTSTTDTTDQFVK